MASTYAAAYRIVAVQLRLNLVDNATRPITIRYEQHE